MAATIDPARTELLSDSGRHTLIQRFELGVEAGPDTGRTAASRGARMVVGSEAGAELQLDDSAVSRFHCEVVAEAGRIHVRDLGSRNGTSVDGVTVIDAVLHPGAVLGVGRNLIRFRAGPDHVRIPLSPRSRFGTMVGSSAAIRAAFEILERAAATDATVLLTGETGTGKEAAAESLHMASSRRDRPFLVVDCGSIPPTLLEAELFGHDRGAFTGAAASRIGAFEAAGGGTVFLDEIGELAVELQPKLLRVLERREIRRLGSNAYRPADVRVIAATHRDLRAGVNGETFRADLYYRLAVLRVALPPLRARPDDISALARHLVEQIGAPPAAAARLLEPEFLASLARSAWPGNVRELRNHLERCAVFEQPALPDPIAEPRAPTRVDIRVPYGVARARLLAEFERAYADELLRAHDGNLSAAARAGGLDRVHLWRLAGRHGLK